MKNIKFILLFGFLLLMIKSYSQNDTLIAKDGTLLAGTNYDNQPIEGVAPDDYVITAGIGWEL